LFSTEVLREDRESESEKKEYERERERESERDRGGQCAEGLQWLERSGERGLEELGIVGFREGNRGNRGNRGNLMRSIKYQKYQEYNLRIDSPISIPVRLSLFSLPLFFFFALFFL
jgi:hypothetical protein